MPPSRRRSTRPRPSQPIRENKSQEVEVKVRNRRILPRKCDVLLTGPIERQLKYFFRKISSSSRIATKKVTGKGFLIVKANKIVMQQQAKFSNISKGKHTIRDILRGTDEDNNCIVLMKGGKGNVESTVKRRGKVKKFSTHGADGVLLNDIPENQKTVVPKWAEERVLSRTLRRSQRTPADVIFAQPDSPNLDAMFPESSGQRNIWNSPSK